jgi:tetratricopeptide (TPR) repeat protein
MVKGGEKELNEGIAFFKNGNCDDAKLKLEEALQKNPKFREGYLYIAECALKKAAFHEVLENTSKAVSLDQKDEKMAKEFATLLYTAGHRAMEEKDFANAVLLFQKSASLEEKNSDTHLWLGKAYLERGGDGDLKSAITAFKISLDQSGNKEETLLLLRESLFDRARRYSSQNATSLELKCYLAYTENFDQKDIDAYITVGRLFLKMGNPLGALYYAKKAYALDHKNRDAIELMDDLNMPIHP